MLDAHLQHKHKHNVTYSHKDTVHILHIKFKVIVNMHIHTVLMEESCVSTRVYTKQVPTQTQCKSFQLLYTTVYVLESLYTVHVPLLVLHCYTTRPGWIYTCKVERAYFELPVSAVSSRQIDLNFNLDTERGNGNGNEQTNENGNESIEDWMAWKWIKQVDNVCSIHSEWCWQRQWDNGTLLLANDTLQQLHRKKDYHRFTHQYTVS